MDNPARAACKAPSPRLHSSDGAITAHRRKALIAGGLCWTGFAIVVWCVASGRTEGLDRLGLLAMRTDAGATLAGPEWMREAVRDTTALGGVFLRHLLAASATVALLFLGLRREATLFVATVLTGWLANSALKAIVDRERPQIVPHLTEAGGAGFPSGHSFNAAVIYIAMALAFAALSRRRSVRLTLVGAAMLISAMVAWSRVMLGVHFPSDVIAGWLGGAGWAFMAAAAAKSEALPHRRSP